MGVYQLLDQARAVHGHHRGVNVETLRGLNRKVDCGLKLSACIPPLRLGRETLPRLAALGIRGLLRHNVKPLRRFAGQAF